MIEREKIQHGTRLRLLRPQHGVAFGTVGPRGYHTGRELGNGLGL
jgi:hypothetical protein